jgi:hypothetical protein
MKGTNELRLNEATMVEALQYWLNAQMAAGKAPCVSGISVERNVGINEFVIRLTEPEAVA